MLKSTFTNISNYLSLVKFSHTIFSLPFAFIGFFLAVSDEQYSFSLKLFLLVVLCMFFARNAAMGFNRYIDKGIDKKNPRTLLREIPSKIINPSSAFLFAIINSIIFIVATFFINKLCFYLSPIALLIILGYSFTKRFTLLCHLILGLGLSLAPIGAYLAVTGKFDVLPILYSFAVLFWVSGFDIIYALLDEKFDVTQNLKSIPAYIGKKNAIIISIIFHLITTFFILFAGFYHNFAYLYWIGAIIFIGLLIYQHLLVKSNDLSKINIAFFTTNGFASIFFSIFVIADLYFIK